MDSLEGLCLLLTPGHVGGLTEQEHAKDDVDGKVDPAGWQQNDMSPEYYSISMMIPDRSCGVKASLDHFFRKTCSTTISETVHDVVWWGHDSQNVRSGPKMCTATDVQLQQDLMAYVA